MWWGAVFGLFPNQSRVKLSLCIERYFSLFEPLHLLFNKSYEGRLATMNQKHEIQNRKYIDSISRSLLFGIISVFCLTLPLGAAITPTGDVEPVGTWTSSTTGYIGNTSDGSLLVDAGSVLQSGYTYFGYNDGVTGAATVTGTNSKWNNTNSSLIVGYNGTGTLRIEAGGQVSSSGVNLGVSSGSYGSATVTGAKSRLNDTYLYIGGSGSGTLRIEVGGQVSGSDSYLGYSSGSTGTATVTGTGSKWTNSGSLYVGKSGTGSLTVDDGGVVTTGTLYASLTNLYGNGTITATNGAVLDADLRFDAAHPSQATLVFGSGGTLTVTAGGGVLAAR
jgi:T5SS/PEP-CTERM-associated repeat protein